MKITLRHVQLIDVSFRHTVDPLEGNDRKNAAGGAQIQVDLVRGENAKGEDTSNYAVKLKVLVNDPKSTYDIAASYAAILGVELQPDEVPPDNLDQRLMVTGASMLFPYVRELVSSLTQRSRFGPVWLQPINFNRLFATPKEPSTSQAAGAE